MKKVLILGYKDTPLQGHALSVYKRLSSLCDAYLLCYVSTGVDEGTNSFCSLHGGVLSRAHYWLHRLSSKIRFILNKKNKREDTDEYCFFNSTCYFAKSAQQVLKKTGVSPDIIIICLHDFFISPKTIFDLYQLTKAQIVVLMVDPNIMTGGCHYPNECKGYQSDCKSCPVLKDGRIAEKLFNEKLKYLKEIPLVLVGTSYDLNRAQLSPILFDKRKIKWLTIPPISINKSREEARTELGFAQNEFVILAGSGSLLDKRKGYHYLYESLRMFNVEVEGGRPVTFLLLGKDQGENLDFGDRIRVVRPGFLSTEGLITAFYASDVFCSTSLDDTGPYMVVYSIACGTPVVSFPVGQAIDLVIHKKTGYLAEYKNSVSIKEGLLFFYKMDEREHIQYSKNCKQLCEEINKDIPWYEQILNL